MNTRIRRSAARPATHRTLACLFLLVGLLTAVSAQAQLTIELTVPASTPADQTVYVAGTFNGWNPGNPQYALTDQGSDLWVITLPTSVRGSVEFKFTLGSWETVEMNAAGFDVPNRTYTIPATGTDTYLGTVATWRNVDNWPLPNSTATPSVSMLDFDFEIPQLDRTRRIWIYLPPDYASTTKRYPVIYMQDGQNVFDAATSFAGEWQVDETLDELHAGGDWGAIVVAIANGEGNRSNEYHPWPHPQYGGGQGGLYIDFLVDTLKPHIDANYRTLTNRRNTGIGGSSSAGLISFYGAIHSPAVFGRILAFSPAFFANPEIFDATLAAAPLVPPTLFTFVSGLFETVGGLPAGVFADTQLAMVDTLDTAGHDIATDVRSLLPADGAHSEWFWRREFPAAYQWLFDNNDADSDGLPDFADNCINAANPAQRDTDNDGFGNFCDADLDNSGAINFADLEIFGQAFFTADADADLNGDGIVNFIDLDIVSASFFGLPGPSGQTQ